MAMSLLNNVTAMGAQNQLRLTNKGLEQSLERLSTGLRINSAADGPAAFAIGERLQVQVQGLQVAERNTNSAVSMLQVASGGIGESQNMLKKIRTLALEAGNGDKTAADRASLQKEASQLLAEITRQMETTQFNGMTLFDGTMGDVKFQVGANEGQTITVDSFQDLRASTLASHEYEGGQAAFSTAVTTVTAFNITNDVNSSVQQLGSITASNADTGVSAAEVAAKINEVDGFTATASTSFSLVLSGILDEVLTDDNDQDITFDLNGVTIDVLDNTNGDFVGKTVAEAIDWNEVAGQISSSGLGFTATYEGEGRFKLESNGESVEVDWVGNGTYTGTAALTLESADETVTQAITSGTAQIATGVVDITGPYNFSIAATGAGSNTNFNVAADATKTGGLAGIDLSTVAGAEAAIGRVDAALETLIKVSSDIGSYTNRFESTLNNLADSKIGQTAGYDTAVGVDFAAETTNLTRQQILSQANTAMLAQANAMPQQILSLLQ